MRKSILIVDDDTEFSGLLTGVFEQADYRVITVVNANDAFEMLQREEFDLIVTDHRLPGVSGLKFIQQLDEMEVSIPIIMVSGYLEDDTIRELIRSGINGIFMKPLNIFSLLKKASDLLALKGAIASSLAEESSASHDKGAAPSIGGIRGTSQAGRSFIKRALEAASFKRQLLLIGPHGTPFEEIGRDLLQLNPDREVIDVLRPGGITAERLEEYQSSSSKRGIAYIVMEAHRLEYREVCLIEDAINAGSATGGVRAILCLHDTVENLYDSGAIDEELYLFFGTNELRVPALREMPEDLVELTKDLVEEHGTELRVDAKLRLFLIGRPWNENYVELRSIVLRAINLAAPISPQLRHFEAALVSRGGSPDPSSNEREVTALERFLIQEKSRYHEACGILSGNDL